MRERHRHWQRASRLAWGLTWLCLSGLSLAGASENVRLDALIPAVTITPATTGLQLVRVSLPVPEGALPTGMGLEGGQGRDMFPVGLRPLTWHGTNGRFVRRALATFPFRFQDLRPVRFEFRCTNAVVPPATTAVGSVGLEGETLLLNRAGGPVLRARPIWPARATFAPVRVELIESNAFFVWVRYHFPDPRWPGILETRADSLGTVAAVAHLQRMLPGDGRAPDFGWELELRAADATLRADGQPKRVGGEATTHVFTNGDPCELVFDRDRFRLLHPAAPRKRRGGIEVRSGGTEGLRYRYWRCQESDKVPMQQAAWQRAEWVIGPVSQARWTALLEPPHAATLDWRAWDALYGSGPPLDLRTAPELRRLLEYHRDAIVRSVAEGDDWGNLTSYSDGVARGSAFGMNRLNHNAPIFAESWRSRDRRLRDVALLWCDNFYDQSIWWGSGQTGGTRYNNLRAQGKRPLDDDETYMWRSNDAVHFCTKGYDSFWLAYEETGDPRMQEAFVAQTRYAAQHVHADRGECRNVGDARDFLNAFAWTGRSQYLEEGLRLFRELRGKLSDGDLFDQGGKPLTAAPPFIEDDATGSRYGYAKPYIIGYALAGLPALGRHTAREPKLSEVVRAVADFLADSQDPIGGWRYPHPRSSYVIVSQGMEHAWQLVQAGEWLGPQRKHLDAIERVLRQRLLGWRRTGKIFSGLTGWETVTGVVKDRAELNARYARPSDRDATRDYTEGRADFGSSPPEGLVYFPEVLAYYLRHRPASRLLEPARPDEPLGQVLVRVR